MTTREAEPTAAMRRRFNVDEYYRLTEAGMLPQRIELRAGVVTLGVMDPEDPEEIARWRYTVADYRRMLQMGILSAQENAEILCGEVILMECDSPALVRCTAKLHHALNHGLSHHYGNKVVATLRTSLFLDGLSEVLPDISVVPQAISKTAYHWAEDVSLLVEVADQSVDLDNNVKTAAYARQRIPEVWVTDVNAQVVYVHRRPRRGNYCDIQTKSAGDILAPDVWPDVAIPVETVFP